jgi:hypothetical protein
LSIVVGSGGAIVAGSVGGAPVDMRLIVGGGVGCEAAPR